MGVSPMNHGQDARATMGDQGVLQEPYRIMRRNSSSFPFFAVLLVSLLLGGCGRFTKQETILFTDLIRQLSDIDRIARLDTLPPEIVTSADPTGGNDDFNNFLRQGSEPGWMVMADLTGPGYVSRFWFTGGEPDHGIRMFFDGEKKPRINTTIGEFCGGKAPFLPPLAAYENYCFYSFLPIPYARRLVIETREGGYKPGGWPRIFYQVNYSAMPKGLAVESFPRELSADAVGAVEDVIAGWSSYDRSREGELTVVTNVVCRAGERAVALSFAGPAVIRAIRIRPEFEKLASPAEREKCLRDLSIHIRWNDFQEDSVAVPLGDFFGIFWRRTSYQSMFFGMSNGVFLSRFPMPFESAAEVSIENQGAVDLVMIVNAVVEPLNADGAWDPGLGYFHAGWMRTEAADVGKPHPILSVVGAGKYVGCILGVAAAEQSFWILEGDEIIRKDSESAAAWRGTGLEDYFNGGWYYQNVLARPFHGLPFKVPYRTVQYRIHATDAITFNSSFDMAFERGPDNRSPGWMESVAFYYMDSPAKAFGRLDAPGDRVPPPDIVAPATVMTEIWNHERFNDYLGAIEFIDLFLAQYTDFPFADVLRLRKIAYKERADGFNAAKPAYLEFLAGTTNDYARQQAETALWFHEDERNALLAVYCNMKTTVLMDGREMGVVRDPNRTHVWRLQIGSGLHVLGLLSDPQPHPQWVQACLRTHKGDFVTSPEWKQAFNPSGDWSHPAFDDSSWRKIVGTGTKGPPMVPYLWCLPDVLVDVQSKALGLCPPSEWYSEKGTTGYRYLFRVP